MKTWNKRLVQKAGDTPPSLGARREIAGGRNEGVEARPVKRFLGRGNPTAMVRGGFRSVFGSKLRSRTINFWCSFRPFGWVPASRFSYR